MTKKLLSIFSLLLCLSALIGCTTTPEVDYQVLIDEEFEQKGVPGPATPYTGPNSENLPTSPVPSE